MIHRCYKMVCQCCACPQKESKGCGVTFHRFPIDIEMRKLWLQNIGREKGWLPSKYTRICSKHFTEDCLYKEKSDRVGKNWLKPTAVPTIFDRNWKPKKKIRAHDLSLEEAEVNEISQQVLLQPLKKKVQLLQLATEPTSHIIQIQQPGVMPITPQIVGFLVEKSGSLETDLSTIRLENIYSKGEKRKSVSKMNNKKQKVEEKPNKNVHAELNIQPECQTSLSEERDKTGLQCKPWSNVKFMEQQSSSLQVLDSIKEEPTDFADIPGTSVEIYSTMISCDLQESESSAKSLPEVNTSKSRKKEPKKRLSFLGDFTPECLQDPSTLKKYMDVIKRQMENKSRRIKVLKQKTRRLQKQVSTLTNTCIELKRQLLHSER